MLILEKACPRSRAVREIVPLLEIENLFCPRADLICRLQRRRLLVLKTNIILER